MRVRFFENHKGVFVTNKIPAIKELRSLVGLGLKEAKDAVEEIIDRGSVEIDLSEEIVALFAGNMQNYEIRMLRYEVIHNLEGQLAACAKSAIDSRRFFMAEQLCAMLAEMNKQTGDF